MNHIQAKIKNLHYAPSYCKELKVVELEDFDINKNPSSFILKGENENFGVSKWVSPKRTRSYPYGRVYDTLPLKNKVTIIPLIKDEGWDGDIDLIQWDTFSLMSLLNVYVIIGYYDKATKNKRYENKITNQQFNHAHIAQKLQELKEYHSSALHWNLKEIDATLPVLIEKVIETHQQIEKELNVRLHQPTGLLKLGERLKISSLEFRDFSRKKAMDAQNREINTLQPKEYLTTASKALINIENYLGGIYHLTVDEISISGNTLELIESKHATKGNLPSDNDIKDGLIKMALFTNLDEASINNKTYALKSVLQLTSPNLKGNLYAPCDDALVSRFMENNNFSRLVIDKLNNLLCEAKQNHFELRIIAQ